mmetsp:Transcript_105920/g.252704  ORF Transcript_105920/g.252704 Transcript_105920/m.252704 type:complete len:297 (+) Transcript_105920:1626-2516(+)
MDTSTTEGQAPMNVETKLSGSEHRTRVWPNCSSAGGGATTPARRLPSTMDASNRGSTRLRKGRSCASAPVDLAVWPLVKVGNCISLSSVQTSSVLTPTSTSSSPVWQLVVFSLQYFSDLPARKSWMSCCGFCWKRFPTSMPSLLGICKSRRSRSLASAARCAGDALPARLNLGMVDSYSAMSPPPRFLPMSGEVGIGDFLAILSFSLCVAFLMADAETGDSFPSGGVGARRDCEDIGRKVTLLGVPSGDWLGGDGDEDLIWGIYSSSSSASSKSSSYSISSSTSSSAGFGAGGAGA